MIARIINPYTSFQTEITVSNNISQLEIEKCEEVLWVSRIDDTLYIAIAENDHLYDVENFLKTEADDNIDTRSHLGV